MGYAERANAAAGFPRILANRLRGLRAAVDVQHLYREGKHRGDRGSIFQLPNGTHIHEADAALLYAQSLTAWLRARGAEVLTNDPAHGIMVGPYSGRTKAAASWGADCFLACHLNADGGSYALLEYPAATSGYLLAASIGASLTAAFKEITNSKQVALTPGTLGFVCVGGFSESRPAVIVEPFFGDNPRHQGLLSPPMLSLVGATVGAGVAQWWENHRP